METNVCILYEDNWNDWHKYQTLYQVHLFDENGQRTHLGEIKIGQDPIDNRPALKREFEHLEPEFFSLGQSSYYYENLNKLGPVKREKFLRALRDIALDLDLLKLVEELNVTKDSLMRSVTRTEVNGQFHRIASGGARLTEYNFEFQTGSRAPSFEVFPDSSPPSNVHVLIGANGAGKTTTLNKMARTFVQSASDSPAKFVFHETDVPAVPFAIELNTFANVVSVSFSAFDTFAELVPDVNEGKYKYIGINKLGGSKGDRPMPKEWQELALEFGKSLENCCSARDKLQRWQTAIARLESDTVFQSSGIGSLPERHKIDDVSEGEFRENASRIFSQLSSGHKIALLTITRLVELVEERTLVLFDEPEAHLHPPFLSSLIRAISELLINRNGVAIIATHSPVVLQEVPQNCVWKLRRVSLAAVDVEFERPRIETFGENVGVLTHEVFRLEVTYSGYFSLLREQVEKLPDYDFVLGSFKNQMGMEGRAILRALIANRKR